MRRLSSAGELRRRERPRVEVSGPVAGLAVEEHGSAGVDRLCQAAVGGHPAGIVGEIDAAALGRGGRAEIDHVILNVSRPGGPGVLIELDGVVGGQTSGDRRIGQAVYRRSGLIEENGGIGIDRQNLGRGGRRRSRGR